MNAASDNGVREPSALAVLIERIFRLTVQAAVVRGPFYALHFAPLQHSKIRSLHCAAARLLVRA
jgi:hypothetical protein